MLVLEPPAPEWGLGAPPRVSGEKRTRRGLEFVESVELSIQFVEASHLLLPCSCMPDAPAGKEGAANSPKPLPHPNMGSNETAEAVVPNVPDIDISLEVAVSCVLSKKLSNCLQRAWSPPEV